MKKYLIAGMVLMLAAMLGVGCTSKRAVDPALQIHPDGRYRGVYGDGGEQQISIEFHLKDGLLTKLSFRHLQYKGKDYGRTKEGDAGWPVLHQHGMVLAYLEGKPLSAVLDLYTPEKMVADVDGFSGATIRGSKIISAIRDGLNRGIY